MKARLIATVGLLFLLAGTQGRVNRSVADDLDRYQNQGIVPLRLLMAKRAAGLNRLTERPSFSQGEAVVALRNVVMPAQEQLLAKLIALHPRTSEVRELHSARIAYEAHYLESMRLQLLAAEQRSPSLQSQADAMMKQTHEEGQQFATRQREIAAKYGFALSSK